MEAKQKFRKLLLPIGLLCLGGSFLVHYLKGPDFANGFLKGLGLVFVVVSLLWRRPKTAQ